MEPNMAERLTDALQRAATAHGLREQEPGKPDPGWPQWHAKHMTCTLTEDGYRLTRLGSALAPSAMRAAEGSVPPTWAG